MNVKLQWTYKNIIKNNVKLEVRKHSLYKGPKYITLFRIRDGAFCILLENLDRENNGLE